MQTGDGASFSALIFPDTQSADYSGVQRLAHQAWTSHKDAQLYISMGDLVDNGEDKQQWQSWFDAMTGLRENIPLAAVMGNHETYNLAWKVRQPAAFTHFSTSRPMVTTTTPINSMLLIMVRCILP